MRRYQNNLDILRQLSEMSASKNVEIKDEFAKQEIQPKVKYIETYKKLLYFYNSELFTTDFYFIERVFKDFLYDIQDEKLKKVGLGKVELKN